MISVMKKSIYDIIAASAVALVLIFSVVTCVDNKELQEQGKRHRRNSEALAGEIERYKVNDSLNAARVRSLELTVEEFERYRAADAALIKSLKQRNRDLESITSTQSQTIIELRAAPKDTVIIRDSVPVMAKAVRCGDAWYDFEGLMTDKEFSGNLTCRDSLIVSESVEHKRFLGILWKTRRVKNRQVDVVSRNPHTEIQDIVYVVIED